MNDQVGFSRNDRYFASRLQQAARIRRQSERADSGYQGIADYHPWSIIPKKKSKNCPLSDVEKAYNTGLSRQRIFIGNINAKIKVFKIMANPYRNRRRRHLLRTKLICAIINAERG